MAKITTRPDIYLRELRAELNQERGEAICLTTIGNACKALEQSRKKMLRAQELDRLDVAEQRTQWCASQDGIDVHHSREPIETNSHDATVFSW